MLFELVYFLARWGIMTQWDSGTMRQRRNLEGEISRTHTKEVFFFFFRLSG